MSENSLIGKSVPRVDGIEKVTGEVIFASDIELPGMLVGRLKRSPYPFARILSVNIEKARKLPGVRAVITAQNVTQFPYGSVIAEFERGRIGERVRDSRRYLISVGNWPGGRTAYGYR